MVSNNLIGKLKKFVKNNFSFNIKDSRDGLFKIIFPGFKYIQVDNLFQCYLFGNRIGFGIDGMIEWKMPMFGFKYISVDGLCQCKLFGYIVFISLDGLSSFMLKKAER